MQEEAIVSIRKLNEKITILKTKITPDDDYLKEFLKKIKGAIRNSIGQSKVSEVMQSWRLPEREAVKDLENGYLKRVLRVFMNDTFHKYSTHGDNLESVSLVEETICFYLYINEMFHDIVVLLELSHGVIMKNTQRDYNKICGMKGYANDLNAKCVHDFQLWLQENHLRLLKAKRQQQKIYIMSMIENTLRILNGREEVSYALREIIKQYISICEDEYIRIKYYDYDENRLGKAGVLCANKYFNMNTSTCETAYMRNFHNVMAYDFERTLAKDAKDQRGELKYSTLNEYQRIFGIGDDESIIPPEILRKIFEAMQIALKVTSFIPGAASVVAPISIPIDVARFVIGCVELHKLRQGKGLEALNSVDVEIICSFVNYSKRLAIYRYHQPFATVQKPIFSIDKDIQKYISLKYLKEIIRVLNIIQKTKFEDIEKEWGVFLSKEFKTQESINSLFSIEAKPPSPVQISSEVNEKLNTFEKSINDPVNKKILLSSGTEKVCFDFLKTIDREANLSVNQEIVKKINGVEMPLTKLIDDIATKWANKNQEPANSDSYDPGYCH